jgi:hypothetical protein
VGWLRHYVFDSIWPTIERPSRDQRLREKTQRTARRDVLMNLRSVTGDADLRSSREAIDALNRRENERIAGVDERLRGLVSLAAIAAAITVAIGIRRDLPANPSQTWLTLVSLYAVLQLLAALLAAVRGLGRTARGTGASGSPASDSPHRWPRGPRARRREALS